MARLRLPFALAWLVTLAACSGAARPPDELGGLWSAGQAACAAGVGLRFTPHAIEAVYQDQHETLFARPRYAVEAHGAAFRVRISYQLPQRPGGARSVGARGEVVLARQGAGIAAVSHNLHDGLTGAARVRLANDPAETLFRLRPCGSGHPWRSDLRGREA